MSLAEQVAQLEARAVALQRRVVELLAERTRHLDRVDELEGLLRIKDTGHPPLNLPPRQAKLLNMLLSREMLPNEIALTILGRDTDPKALDTHYMRIRKALPKGVTIRTRSCVGRYIPEKEKQILRAGL